MATTIDRTTAEHVKARLLAERGGAGGSWPWTARFIDVADRQFGGHWEVVRLDAAEALGVLLPRHAGEPCHGDRLTLVDPAGATVADAAAALAVWHAAYARDNPTCFGRIRDAADAPFSTLVLASAPLGTEEHAGLSAADGRLYHVDGFHRLVGWAWAGRLLPGAGILACLAGGRAA